MKKNPHEHYLVNEAYLRALDRNLTKVEIKITKAETSLNHLWLVVSLLMLSAVCEFIFRVGG